MGEGRVRFDPAPPGHQRLGELSDVARRHTVNRDIRCRTEQVLGVLGAADLAVVLGAAGAGDDADGPVKVLADDLEDQDQTRLGEVRATSAPTIEILDERNSLKVSRVYPPSSGAGCEFSCYVPQPRSDYVKLA